MDEIKDRFNNFFKVIKVDDNTYAIKEFKISYDANCFLIIEKGEAILIDSLSGIYPNFIFDLEKIFNVTINKLYLTHAHYDHFGGCDEKIIHEVYLSDACSDRLKNYYLKDEDVRKEIDDGGNSNYPPNFDIDTYKVKKINNFKFFESDNFVFGNRCFEIIKTPGHSKDSVCFYEKDKGYLYTGDTVYLGVIDIFEDPSRNFNDYINSIKKLKDKKVSKYLCGHGQAVVLDNELDLKMIYQKIRNLKLEKNQTLFKATEKISFCIKE